MRTFTLENEPVAVDVTFEETAFRVVLDDGRELTVPLTWFPRLLHGTPDQRARWELIGRGEGLHWEVLDEDISVAGLLAGRQDQTRPNSPSPKGETNRIYLSGSSKQPSGGFKKARRNI